MTFPTDTDADSAADFGADVLHPDVLELHVPDVDVLEAETAGVAAGSVDTGPVVAATEFALDEIAAAAVDLARSAAIELGGDEVGEHLGASPEADRVVTHAFAATKSGYLGWYWAVTVARGSRTDVATVDEVVLLPGPDALLAPAWLPWSQRVLPGDLGAGDLLPADPDDIRLVPGYADGDVEDQVSDVAFELGLGRARVLSFEGRVDAAERWFEGEGGPDSPIARQAPAHCGSCGFMVSISGPLRAAFGVCANEFSTVDGRVVSVAFGCGAHSESPTALSLSAPSGVIYDDGAIDLVANEATVADDPGAAQSSADDISWELPAALDSQPDRALEADEPLDLG